MEVSSLPTLSMTPKKPKASAKVKPVKGWAIVSPEGKIVVFCERKLFAIADATWEFGIPGGREGLEAAGYRCIRVLVTPL